MILRFKRIDGQTPAVTNALDILAQTTAGGSEFNVEMVVRKIGAGDIGTGPGQIKHASGMPVAAYKGSWLYDAILVSCANNAGTLVPETMTQKVRINNLLNPIDTFYYSDSASTLDAGSTLTFLVISG